MSEIVYSANAFIELAQSRFDDAMLLYEHGRFSSAYYIAGYAVELALKAQIARSFKADTIPDLRFVQNIYKHDLKSLLNLSGLAAVHQEFASSNEKFLLYWSIIEKWDVASRYGSHGQSDCSRMIEALADPQDGVFQWLKTFW